LAYGRSSVGSLISSSLCYPIRGLSVSMPNQVADRGNSLFSPNLVFVGLITLTVLSAFIGEFSESNQGSLVLVLVLMVIKTQLIIDHFMHLKNVKLKWRLSMSAFAVVIGSVAWLVLW
jgi:cytochrome c oxidase subunit 4